MRASRTRGVIPVASCLTVKGAEDVLNKPYAFELSLRTETMYFIANSEKEKEDWIYSLGRSIVQHSRNYIFVNQSSFSGMLPSNLDSVNESRFGDEKFLGESGILPLKLFLLRPKATSFGKLRIT
ncbi:hypothetical protein EZV62_006792 [Acer yangbiense]|uniref:PH domain-containing protein n=1 Tax=Acer yangbiense TaxID=1000413 RepID=A0A5C7I8M9_9ROSI|nr:hypothetical protein EZV62_006792 [Acer yangbiense]